MKSQVLSNWDMPWLPLTALFIFIGIFMCMFYYSYSSRNKQKHKEVSALPLEEGEKYGK
jgi:cbb3-type cytochrome oxidase subunit 3